MGDREEGMARRVAAARARIEEAGLHAVGRGGGSLGKFTEGLHPRSHGKFAHSFTADAHLAKRDAERAAERDKADRPPDTAFPSMSGARVAHYLALAKAEGDHARVRMIEDELKNRVERDKELARYRRMAP